LRRWRIEDSIGFPAWGRVSLLGVVPYMRFKDRYQPSNAEVEMCALFCNAQLFELQEMRKCFYFFAHSCQNVKVVVAPEPAACEIHSLNHTPQTIPIEPAARAFVSFPRFLHWRLRTPAAGVRAASCAAGTETLHSPGSHEPHSITRRRAQERLRIFNASAFAVLRFTESTICFVAKARLQFRLIGFSHPE